MNPRLQLIAVLFFALPLNVIAEKIETADQLMSVGCDRLITKKSGSDNVDDYVAIATCLTLKKRSDLAVEYLNRALKIKPNDPEILTSLAIAQGTGGGTLAEAGETYWRVAQIEPTKGNLYLAAFYLQFGERYAQAVEPYEKLVALEPKNPLYLYGLGTCLSRSEKIKEADKVFSDALLAVPGNASIQGDYALHLARQKRFEGALKQANSAIESEPKSAESFSVLGQVYEMQDEKEKAAQAYESALGLDPEHSPARIKLTRVRLSQNRFDDVIVNGLKILKKFPDERNIHEMLLQAFEKTNQKEMADQERLKIKELDAKAIAARK